MRKTLTQQDNCYTPKYLVDYFGLFDYDPATTKEQANYLNILNYDTIETNGLTKDWNYKKIWLNPPFTFKFEFLNKAVETYRKYNNDIYILFPIESMTTKRWYDIMKDIKFKMYIPNWRLGFIVNNKLYNSGAFGVVVLKLQSDYDIELIEDIRKGSSDNDRRRV